jgi:signal transduction histidine kinase/phage shock protein PspC (stress-responsive transcriptional regulator)
VAVPLLPSRTVRIPRSGRDRVVTGVAGGAARRLGVDAHALRVALGLTAFTGGVGVVVYAGLAALSTAPPSDEPPAPATEPRRQLAFGCAVGAVLLWLRTIGLWPGDGLMLPAALVGAASVVVWHRAGASSVAADPFERLLSGRAGPVRLGVGIVLVAAGLVALAGGRGAGSLSRAAAALALALGGAAVAVGPFVGRLVQQVSDEQRQRIRTEERAEVAAHLHDSVLQTLALMQRSTDDPRRLVLLARRQERELRSWLFDGRVGPAAGTVAGDADAMAADVELDHGVTVELVVVGDAPSDERSGALLAAAREATVNAAKHAGVDVVRLYVEVEPDALVAYVRDTGQGFVRDTVDADRRGIVESIEGRLTRVRGSASLDTASGVGTEWELRVPR